MSEIVFVYKNPSSFSTARRVRAFHIDSASEELFCHETDIRCIWHRGSQLIYGLGSCDGINALSLQMMVERASAGDVDPIDAAAELLLDFINIFLRISPPNVIFKRIISLFRDSRNEAELIVI